SPQDEASPEPPQHDKQQRAEPRRHSAGAPPHTPAPRLGRIPARAATHTVHSRPAGNISPAGD
ncbi:hypothetical protein, partial [Streptomyces yangpuensis]